MKRRLEEALEQCLAALASGQSTVEECLALHSDLAAELEPLLHTARRLQAAYAVDPLPAYEQAARQRFLAALARRRQMRLVARPARPSWRWAPAALGMAALVAFVAWAGVLAFGGGGDEDRLVMEPTEPTSTPAPATTSIPAVTNIQEQVAKVQAHLEEIQSGAEEQGAVEPAAIHQLREETAALVASLDNAEDLELEPENASQIQEVLASQEQVLSGMKDKVAPEVAQDLDDAISIAQAGLASIQKYLAPTATPTPPATPVATPSATPTPTPTPTPAESPTSTPPPTSTPAATSTPEVSPTETPQPTPSLAPEGSEEPSPTATVAP